jgi:Spy/CpxP family protein refolding chaperone
MQGLIGALASKVAETTDLCGKHPRSDGRNTASKHQPERNQHFMPRLHAWMLGAALACTVPAAATPLCGDHPQQTGAPKADAGQQKGTKAGDGKDQQPDSRNMPWWKRPESRAELAITDQQSKAIDDIFQSVRPQLKSGKDDLDKLDDAVSKLIKDGSADVEAVRLRVAQLEQARAQLNQTRTLMLYRMHQVLSKEQRVKLNAMFERWEAERRKQNPSRDHR